MIQPTQPSEQSSETRVRAAVPDARIDRGFGRMVRILGNGDGTILSSSETHNGVFLFVYAAWDAALLHPLVVAFEAARAPGKAIERCEDCPRLIGMDLHCCNECPPVASLPSSAEPRNGHTSYRQKLLESLRNPLGAVHYVLATQELSPESLAKALKNVEEAALASAAAPRVTTWRVDVDWDMEGAPETTQFPPTPYESKARQAFDSDFDEEDIVKRLVRIDSIVTETVIETRKKEA